MASPEARISVIIPSFNRASDLPGAVDTVLAQTHPVDEVIVVDDGSTDGTREVTKSLPSIVRTIHQENRGLSAARNRGIEESEGELLAFLDSDDRWHPRKLEVQVEAMARSGSTWSATNLQLLGPDGRVRSGEDGLAVAVPVFRGLEGGTAEWFGSRLDCKVLETRGIRVRLYFGDAFEPLLNGNFLFESTVVMSREILEEVGGFDPSFRRAVGTEYFLRVAAAGAPFSLVQAPLTYYRVGSDGALSGSRHTVELTELALAAMERAIRERGSLTHAERRAARAGKRRILLDQAYAHVTCLDRTRARGALARLREERLGMGSRGVGILALALLPEGLLALMGRAKAGLRSLLWARSGERAQPPGAFELPKEPPLRTVRSERSPEGAAGTQRDLRARSRR
jgi:GT2 family glycosyltransferase